MACVIAAGEHPAAIARRMGHASTATILDRYGHLLPGLDEGTASALDKLRTTAGTATDDAIRRIREA